MASSTPPRRETFFASTTQTPPLLHLGGAIASCKSLLVRIWNGNQQTRWALIRIDSRSSVQSLTKSIPKVQFKVSKDDALKMYSSMVTLQTMDNIFYEAQRQGRMSFYLTSYGEDAINIALAVALTQDDIILPQYREHGVLLWRGFTLQEFANQCFGNKADYGKGRQMPIHYGSSALNSVNLDRCF
ncbi:2-oxoisovalerate dehydrogenase subunit alpha 2, mitochondrial-like isoform X2 [Camellia sinensis]|uniref:2-oxoisovalerate dehydrogenase subunit alpha 2, mitochondrial-like isoform X2 n=1 Tax=Camellia sinensis TaxID=4442 RepID=UPI001035EB40|nr:2-oxoisovalerate dehydrogenase subunit alpha 2, mitochondrial-like isoform X2 [Camellia sinensis]